MKTTLLTSVLLFLYVLCFAQVKIDVTCNHPDWNYLLNEEVTFSYKITGAENLKEPLEINYQIGEEKMPPLKIGEIKDFEGTIKGGTMTKPGFLRCTILGTGADKTIKGMATAAFEVQKIQPTVKLPSDFESFWSNAIADARKIPLDPIMTEIPEQSNEKVKVYAVNFQNNMKDGRLYGVLTVPNKEGKFPAVLLVPGAGIRPYNANKDFENEDIITLNMGIHGIPVDLPKELYSSLAKASLFEYPFMNLNSKDHYYYKRVYVGCVKAVDFIFGLDKFNGQDVAVSGGSQGGALAIVTAALDPRIKYLRSNYPALCDLTGYLHQRAGGWPHILNQQNAPRYQAEKYIDNLAYYDVVNFARFVKVPGFYTWGYNDETCPPTSYYSAFNMITAPKELLVKKETGHNTLPEQHQAQVKWLAERLNKKN